MSTGWEGCNERVRLGGEFLMFIITSAFLTFFVLFWSGVFLYPPLFVSTLGQRLPSSSAPPYIMGTEPRGF